MTMRWRALLASLAFAAMAAATQTMGQSGSAPALPDFGGVWRHPSLPGFEPPATGPGPVTNRARRNGISNWDQLVGDYTNPILKPAAAEVVKQHGAISLTGHAYPTPANQCWPQPLPYIFWSFGLQILQQSDKITLVYSNPDHEFRQVRLNAPHPPHVTPSWYGDSVAHYEGDALVFDTVGVRTDRPFAMADVYGTPYSAALHVVERYRLLGYEEAKEGLDRDAKENMQVPIDINRGYRGKHLQLAFTVEDPGVFTMPWSATVTYGRGFGDVDEEVCAENVHEYYDNANSKVPTAEKPDF